MSNLASTLRRLDRLEAERRSRLANAPTIADRAVHDWYASSCPCGLAPGECREHPRARAAQRPPDSDWRVWLMQGGRGSGKTRAGAEWLIDQVRRGTASRPILVGQTASDVRDVMVETVLDISPPWFRPRHMPSRRALIWPNGVSGLLISAEDPEQLRGPNVDIAWCDELGAWTRATEAWRNLSLAVRKGQTRVCVTTTPRRNEALLAILDQPTTVVSRSTTLENRTHLSDEFSNQVLALYKGTRFEAAEIHGELPTQEEGSWFVVSESKHVSLAAEYDPGRPIVLGVDAGTSRTTGAVYLQTERIDAYRMRFNVFSEYLAVDSFSGTNADEIRDKLPAGSWTAQIWIDPAARARTSIGPAAFGEYQRVFGDRLLNPAPSWSVTDGLDMLSGLMERGDLLIHPRCTHLIEALKSYQRARSGGQWLDVPAGNQSPHEDMCDALRYAVVGHWPEGRKLGPKLAYVKVGKAI